MLDKEDKFMFSILLSDIEGLGLVCKMYVNMSLFSVECAMWLIHIYYSIMTIYAFRRIIKFQWKWFRQGFLACVFTNIDRLATVSANLWFCERKDCQIK